jgi:hypothetical protein
VTKRKRNFQQNFYEQLHALTRTKNKSISEIGDELASKQEEEEHHFPPSVNAARKQR